MPRRTRRVLRVLFAIALVPAPALATGIPDLDASVVTTDGGTIMICPAGEYRFHNDLAVPADGVVDLKDVAEFAFHNGHTCP